MISVTCSCGEDMEPGVDASAEEFVLVMFDHQRTCRRGSWRVWKSQS